MDTKLSREFVHVHQNTGGDRISEEAKSALMATATARNLDITEHCDTITIACRGLGGLGKLLLLVDHDAEARENDIEFFGRLRGALVTFIG